MRMLVKSITDYNFRQVSGRRRRMSLPRRFLAHRSQGMEMVQVAILVAIAIILGLIFKSEITSFINKTLESLNNGF